MAPPPERRPEVAGDSTIPDVPDIICDALRELDLAGPATPITGEPLTGGVSCDIWRIDLPDRSVCAKRALPKLKVADDWYAPTSRIGFEAAYNRYANTIVPNATPEVLGHDPARGVLVMAFLPPDAYTVWKQELSEGIIRTDIVEQLAGTLRHLHDASRDAPGLTGTFDQPELIHDLRLSPYFLASIQRNPDLENQLTHLVQLFEQNRHWLVHGDFSPKNILFGQDHPVILDAECATLGDAAFDVAFCSAHLFLKAAWKPEFARKYEAAFHLFSARYFAPGRDPDFEARAAKYLAGFLLARVDGKSPVEYITSTADKKAIRDFARTHLKHPAANLDQLADEWFQIWAAPLNTGETGR